MKTAPVALLRDSLGAAGIEELTYVWRDSVEATHHFLPLPVIDRMEPLIRERHLPRLRLQVAERKGSIVGFIGMDQQVVAMLLVADEARSTGVGSQLLDWAKAQYPELSLAVNEQNPRAAVFYIRRGFVPVGRSETEAGGLPCPLVHMRWAAGDAGAGPAAQNREPNQ